MNNNINTQPTTLGLQEGLIYERAGNDENCGVDIEEIKDFDMKIGCEPRKNLNLPNVSEPEVLRHFVKLSYYNYSIDAGFYPLGSCTMKHNPRLNEKLARLSGMANIHPEQPAETVQGAFELMHQLQYWLSELTGLKYVTLLPAAGAHGELVGVMIIKKIHEKKGNNHKEYIVIPSAAHGTNPSTANICGYKVITIDTDPDGMCDIEQIREKVKEYGNKIAGIMLTNPNTCGKFDRNSKEIADLIHSVDGYFYCDGANFNAIVGKVKPRDFGVDVMHFNLHKTFSTPHGGGGPGCGPVAVSEELEPFLPVPKIHKNDDGSFELQNHSKHPDTIGYIKGYYGQFGMMVRALTFMLSHGKDGLRQLADDSVLSANYILHKLKGYYHLPYDGYCMHECLFSDKKQKEQGINVGDIAKAMLDKGMHPMTIAFPLVVPGAMLIEPTESPSLKMLDDFINVMQEISQNVTDGKGETYKTAPHNMPIKRADEVKAAREPIIKWDYNNS